MGAQFAVLLSGSFSGAKLAVNTDLGEIRRTFGFLKRDENNLTSTVHLNYEPANLAAVRVLGN